MQQIETQSAFEIFFQQFEKEVYERAYATIQLAIEEARQDSKLNVDLLNQKEAAKRLNMSVNYLKGLQEKGLPVVLLDNKPMYHIPSCLKWIINNYQK